MAKVDVLTVDQMTFGKLRWWSNWIDVAVFDCHGAGYLLQMKISRTNAKKFKVRRFQSLMASSYLSTADAGNLTQMIMPEEK